MLISRTHHLMGLLLVALAGPGSAEAAIVYELHNGGKLDGHTTGDTAVFRPDSDTGTVATLTTHGATNADGTSGAEINENGDSLGIDSTTLQHSSVEFDGGESWTFSWDADTTLDVIAFNALWKDEAFLVTSPAWQNKSYAMDSDSLLSFNADKGQFRFDDGRDEDMFDLAELVSGDSLLVPANTDYTFAFEPGDGDATRIETLTFSAASAVPEPSAAAALLAAAGAGFVFRLRSRRAPAGLSEA